VQIRCSRDELAAWRRIAFLRDVSIAHLMRMQMRKLVTDVSKVPREEKQHAR